MILNETIINSLRSEHDVTESSAIDYINYNYNILRADKNLLLKFIENLHLDAEIADLEYSLVIVLFECEHIVEVFELILTKSNNNNVIEFLLDNLISIGGEVNLKMTQRVMVQKHLKMLELQKILDEKISFWVSKRNQEFK